MALSVVTIRPNSTYQAGSWSVVGAASAHAALSDNNDSSYVQLLGLCRLDSQVLRVGFPTPSIPAGAKIYSVTLRRRVQSAATTADVPLCFHWFRCSNGTVSVSGERPAPQKSFYNSPCPTTTTPAFTDETILTATAGPGGQAWTTTNLTGFAYDLGRGDASASTTLRVSEVYLDVAYQQASTVTVTGPTGTVSDTRPTITWTYASPDSEPQQAYQVAIYTSAQVAAGGFVPFVSTPLQSTGGYLLGEDLQWTVPNDLTDGTYSAYVQVQSRWAGPGDFFSVVASTTWTRTATAAPVVVPAPILMSPPPAAAVFNAATFDLPNNRVQLTFTPGTPAAAPGPAGVTGAAATAGGTGVLTCAVSPTAVGDVLILATNLTSTSLTVATVSGGGVPASGAGTWTRIAGNYVGTTNTLAIWMGVVSTTGPSTITITGSGSLAAVTTRLIAQQVTSAGGAGTTWSVDVAGTGRNNSSSTTVTYPTITPGGANRLYLGYAQTTSVGLLTGATSGYAVALDNGNNQLIYNTAPITGAQTPTSLQTSAGVSSALAVTITATMTPDTTAFTVESSRNAGLTWVPIPSLTHVPAVGMSTITRYDYVAPLNVTSQYRAIAYAGLPLVAAASPSNVVSATPVDDRHWLKDPSNPLLNTPLPVAAPQGQTGIKVTKRRLMGTFHLLGGAGAKVLPVVVSGPTYGDEYAYELIFIEGDSTTPMTLWPAVDQLDRTGGTLLLQQPDGNQLWVRLGPGAGGQDTEENYNALHGKPSLVHWRRRKVTMTEVDAPTYY